MVEGIQIEASDGKIDKSDKLMCSYSKHGSFFNVECFCDEDVDDGKDKQEKRWDLHT